MARPSSFELTPHDIEHSLYACLGVAGPGTTPTIALAILVKQHISSTVLEAIDRGTATAHQHGQRPTCTRRHGHQRRGQQQRPRRRRLLSSNTDQLFLAGPFGSFWGPLATCSRSRSSSQPTTKTTTTHCMAIEHSSTPLSSPVPSIYTAGEIECRAWPPSPPPPSCSSWGEGEGGGSGQRRPLQYR